MARPAEVRFRVTPQSQAPSASAIAAPNRMATPDGPACCDKTQANQAAAAYMGKAKNCLKVSIQGPGLGIKAKARGQIPNSRKGSEKPAPNDTHTARADGALGDKAKPNAAAMKGAVHGAPTAAASTPVKNAPVRPLRLARPSPAVMELTSKRPERLSPTANTSSAKPATAMGDCSWK